MTSVYLSHDENKIDDKLPNQKTILFILQQSHFQNALSSELTFVFVWLFSFGYYTLCSRHWHCFMLHEKMKNMWMQWIVYKFALAHKHSLTYENLFFIRNGIYVFSALILLPVIQPVKIHWIWQIICVLLKPKLSFNREKETSILDH